MARSKSPRRRPLRAALLAFVLTFCASVTASGSPDAASVLAGLEGWLAGTQDLQGSFRQSLVSGAFGAGLEERGRLYLRRPGQMRWDYQDPDRKTAVVDGDRTWLYIAEERQLTLGRLEQHGRLLPALLAAERPLSEVFAPTLEAEPGGNEAGQYRLALAPHAADEEFERVLVELDARDFAILSAEVQDAAGNRMRYQFSDLRRNRGLPERLFRFDPPEGTLVVGAH